MIEVACSICQKRFEVPDNFAGKTGTCKCGGKISVPDRRGHGNEMAPKPMDGSMRQRRLIADAAKIGERFSGNGPIRVKSIAGDPPDKYIIEYHVKGLAPGQGDEPVPCELHLLEIQLTCEYPRGKPLCKMLSPCFHPNIDLTSVCIGDHWAAGERLADLIARIAEMLSYQAFNIKSPLNGEAAMWADLNQFRFPLDKRDFRAL